MRFETALGSFTLVLSPEAAPLTVANVVAYVDRGFYNHGRFHRATRAANYVINLPNRPLLECIQAGIDGARKPKALPPILLERTSVTGLKHLVGTVSMARKIQQQPTDGQSLAPPFAILKAKRVKPPRPQA